MLKYNTMISFGKNNGNFLVNEIIYLLNIIAQFQSSGHQNN